MRQTTRPQTSTHPCPSPGCPARVERHLFACRSHWYALPADLRASITSLWRQRKFVEWGVAAKKACAHLAVKANRCLGRSPQCARPLLSVDGDVARCEAGHVWNTTTGQLIASPGAP